MATLNSSSFERDEGEELIWWIFRPGIVADGGSGVNKEMTHKWHRQCVSAMNTVVMAFNDQRESAARTAGIRHESHCSPHSLFQDIGND